MTKETLDRIIADLENMRDSGERNQKFWPHTADFWRGYTAAMKSAKDRIERVMTDD